MIYRIVALLLAPQCTDTVIIARMLCAYKNHFFFWKTNCTETVHDLPFCSNFILDILFSGAFSVGDSEIFI
jgi:hypothetical protein